MKKKFGIKTRVFLGFWFMIILLLNLVIYVLSILSEQSFLRSVEKDIEKTYHFIEKNIKEWTNISHLDQTKILNRGQFYEIATDNNFLKENYKSGFFFYDNEYVIFRGDVKNTTIIVWESIIWFLDFKKRIIELTLYINAFSIILIFMMSYFVTTRLLKPLIKLSKTVYNYNLAKNKNLIKNNYGNSEIWLITDSINKLIENSRNILISQKNFIQDTNHELKTPLMQIDSNIEMLEGKITDPKIQKRIDEIKSSTQNINEIVTNLGFILRGEEKETLREKINIFEYLQKQKGQYKALAKEKNIEILLEKKWELVVENNSYYLDRLFGNLIQNAIFYNKWNNTIQIEVHEKKVRITDQGIGMNEKEIGQIYSRFYRNKNSSLYNNKGNGLWLTIVKKICDDFWWKIEISSEPNKWTSFTIFMK